MRQKRDISPYMASTDDSVNESLTWAKLFKRLRMVNPSYKPSSRYQMRHKHRLAARRMRPGVVR